MNTKKWKNISIVSLALIVVELVLFFVLALPAMKTNSFFKKLENGNAKEASSMYRDFSDGQKKKIKQMVPDFGTYECNKFIDGKEDYEKPLQALKALSEMKGLEETTKPYLSKLVAAKLTDIYEEGAAEYSANEYSSKFSDLCADYTDVYYGATFDEDAVDKELSDILQAKYDSFLAGEIEYEEVKGYAYAGEYMFRIDNDGYELATKIVGELYYIEQYITQYDEAMQYYDDEDYFGCMDYCDNELSWYFADGEEDTTGYYEKFTSLRQDAYDTGKTFYIDKAKSLIDEQKIDEAKEILTQVDEVYGDEVDTSEVWALIRGAWMDPYIAFLDDWDNNLRAALEVGVKIGDYDDTSTINYDNYVPYNVYLYDFDANGTPELMLRSGDYLYYILTYDGTEVVLTGAVTICSLLDAPQLLTEPISMPDGYSGYEILELSGSTWSVVEYYIGNGTRYEVNGQEATVDEAEALYDKFEGMQQDKSLNYVPIDGDYKTFIYDYEE